MEAEPISIVLDYLNPARLFGPIFDKELRVSSRRKRNYLIRSLYIILLVSYILTKWYSVGISGSSSIIYRVSRMAEIGQSVIIGIIWFQFVVLQVLAIIMLSSSISDEIRTGTLNVLMTTPINSFQIVTGKLSSKLLQVLLLLAMSLPLLAIVRVLGGISWHYLVSSFLITLTAVLFAGSLSLLLSIFYRQAHHVILIVLIGYLLFFGILPSLLFSKLSSPYSIATLINPVWAMVDNTVQITTPATGFVDTFFHCLIMSGISFVLLAISVLFIRHAAIGGKHPESISRKVIKDEKGVEVAHYYENHSYIHRVVGSPVMWKEKQKGFWGKNQTDRIVTISLVCLFVLLTIAFFFSQNNTISIIITRYSISGMFLAVMVRLAVETAGSIAGEKEARTLPVLLVSPLKDKDIIRGKVKAALWRNFPLLILYLFLNILLYIFPRSIGFFNLILQIPFLALSITFAVLFIIGCGSYFGVRAKNSATAIALTIGSYFAYTYLLNPVLISIFYILSRTKSKFMFVMLIVTWLPKILMGAAGWYLLRRSIRELRYNVF